MFGVSMNIEVLLGAVESKEWLPLCLTDTVAADWLNLKGNQHCELARCG